MALAIMGGIGIGALCALVYGGGAEFIIPIAILAGIPLGIGTGLVLAIVGVLMLVPYRGHIIPVITISGIATCAVTLYLKLGLVMMAGFGAGEGPQSTDGPSWDWVLITASMAAAVLSPWIVWWYVKLMEQSPKARDASDSDTRV